MICMAENKGGGLDKHTSGGTKQHESAGEDAPQRPGNCSAPGSLAWNITYILWARRRGWRADGAHADRRPTSTPCTATLEGLAGLGTRPGRSGSPDAFFFGHGQRIKYSEEVHGVLVSLCSLTSLSSLPHHV